MIFNYMLVFFAGFGYTMQTSKQYTSSRLELPDVFASKGAFPESTVSQSATSTILKTNTLFVTIKPVLNRELYTNYLTVGVGVIIAMLFFIILKQFCKKSQSSNQKLCVQRKRNIDQMCDETSNHSHNSNETNYKFISPSQQLDHNYKEMNAVYEEIDDCMELNEPSDFLNEETCLEGDTDRFECVDLTSVVKNDDISSPTSSLYLLPTRGGKSTGSDTDKSDLYLQPIFILENNKPEEKEEIHSYIEITG